MTTNPHQLLEQLRQENHYLAINDPEFVSEELFIEATKELIAIAPSLYLTIRPYSLAANETKCGLWTDQPVLQENDHDDWQTNKSIALLETTIEKAYQHIGRSVYPLTNTLKTKKIKYGQIYRLK